MKWIFLTVAILSVATACRPRRQFSQSKADGLASTDVNFDQGTNPFPDYTIYDQGKECYEAMNNTPFPNISCLDGALLPIYEDGVEARDRTPMHCDKPDLVDPAFGCVPGGRIRKEVVGDIISMYMCRRLPKPETFPIDSDRTHNIAAYQFNRATGAVCWFQIRRHTEGIAATRLIPPYEAGRVKGDARDKAATELYVEPGRLVRGDACVRCHDSQLFLRTPYVSQAKYSPRATDRANAVPDITTHGRLKHIGLPFASWNRDDAQPFRIRVNPSVYDQAFPLTAEEQQDVSGGKMEGSDACAACHAIGKSRLEHNTPGAHRGTCNDIIRAWTHPGTLTPVNERWLSESGKKPARLYWMPPSSATTDAEAAEWPLRFKRAIAAVKRCCEDPELTFNGQKVCGR